MIQVVWAELELARGRPLRALERLPTEPLPEAWRTAAEAVRTRARTGLGLSPVPLQARSVGALALADRGQSLALSAAASRGPDRTALAHRLGEVAASLAGAGLVHRAALLETAQAFLLGEEPGHRILDRALGRLAAGGDPRLEAAARILRASWALDRSEPSVAQELCRLGPRAASATPGRLLAAMHLTAARAALAAGDEEEASAAVAEGLLDLQEADLTRIVAPEELRPIEEMEGRPALALPGVGLAADLAAGHPVAAATSRLLKNLTRTSRGWSVLDRSWGESPAEIARSLPGEACLVLATADPRAPWIAIGPEGAAAALPPGDQALSRPPCATASVLYWAGPAAAPPGLTWPGRPDLLVVRVVRPVALPAAPPRRPAPAAPGGSWARTPAPPAPPGGGPGRSPGVPGKAAPAGGEGHWPLHVGAGLVPAAGPWPPGG
ncbi:MAG: hypothetical protein Q9Q13_03520 [Acidobacteriota bacterium]|nr:hypothetical protein [Acidobacteriota bacterium]